MFVKRRGANTVDYVNKCCGTKSIRIRHGGGELKKGEKNQVITENVKERE